MKTDDDAALYDHWIQHCLGGLGNGSALKCWIFLVGISKCSSMYIKYEEMENMGSMSVHICVPTKWAE